VACTFCLKPTADVETMVAGPGVCICDGCVTICVQLIESKPDETSPVAAWERDLSDEDLLKHLPKVAAVGAQVDRQLSAWVRQVRARGITWTRIGAALDMTRQSAWERFSGED
jgi:ATP-dependent protease Clp ATPase subunit